VRRTGGLQDTVKDIGDPGGFGICFNTASVGDICTSIYRAVQLYEKKEKIKKIIEQIKQIDHRWEKSAEIYINLYRA
jgi:starch synthase